MPTLSFRTRAQVRLGSPPAGLCSAPPAQSPAAPVDPLQQAYAGMQHYTGEPRPGPGGGVEGERGPELGLGQLL